jgi:hypothetical protein
MLEIACVCVMYKVVFQRIRIHLNRIKTILQTFYTGLYCDKNILRR